MKKFPPKAAGAKHDDMPADKRMVASAIGKHEGNMHKGKPKTKLAAGGACKPGQRKGGAK